MHLWSRLLLTLGLAGVTGLMAVLWQLRPAREHAAAFLDGSVVDQRGAMAGALVRFQGQCPSQPTDAQGRFRLPRSPSAAPRVTAWKAGYAIGAAPSSRQPLQLLLRPLPATDNEDYEWTAPRADPRQPNNCGNCHSEITRDWAASAHASSANNRRLLGLMDGTDWHGQPAADGWNLARQKPDGAGVCVTCHAPTFNDPTLHYDLRKVTGAAAFGVHCDYCHKIVDAQVDRLPLTFGRDGLTLLRPPQGEQLFFGPLDDAVREGESFGYSPLYKESRYCASCHEGVLFGVHVYSTYSEWQASPARRQGKECQTCHMAPTGKLTNIAPGKGGIERDPHTLSSHLVKGADADMLRRCLTVDLTAKDAGKETIVNVAVRATDVGHRVPTGFIDRHLVLAVEASAPDGQRIALKSGPKLPALAGEGLTGVPGWLYARRLKDADQGSPAPFWLWAGKDDPTDTRLVPEEADRRAFVFAQGAARLRVRLLYRRFWPQIAQQRGWPANEITVVDRALTLKLR